MSNNGQPTEEYTIIHLGFSPGETGMEVSCSFIVNTTGHMHQAKWPIDEEDEINLRSLANIYIRKTIEGLTGDASDFTPTSKDLGFEKE